MNYLGYISSDPLVLWIKSEMDDRLNEIILPSFTMRYLYDDLIAIYSKIGLVAIVKVTHDLNNKNLTPSMIRKLENEGLDLSHLNMYAKTDGIKVIYTRDFKLMHTMAFREGIQHISTLLRKYNIQTVDKCLAIYDDPNTKKFDQYDVTIELGELDITERNREECQFEFLAFNFAEYPHGDSPWGGHFGPQFTANNGAEFPSKNQITPEAIKYWEKRVNSSNNPIMISRYAGIVWDFKEEITGERPSGILLSLLIDSLIKCAEGDYPKYSISGLQMIVRAFDLARMSKKQELYPRIKSVFATYEGLYYKDEHPGIWGVRYHYMMSHPSMFTLTEQKEIISKIETSFENLLTKSPNGVGNEKLDPWMIMDIATALCDYHLKLGDKTLISNYLQRAEKSYNHSAQGNSGLRTQGWLDHLHRIYQHYGLTKDAERMMVEMQSRGKEVLNELQSHQLEFEYPKEEIEKLEHFLTEGTEREIIERMILYFTPKRDDEETLIKKIAKQSPLQFLMPTQLLDYKGRAKSVIGSIDADLEGHIIMQTSRTMDLGYGLLRHIIRRNIEKGHFTSDKLVNYLVNSPVIDKDRIQIIKRGLDAYFSGDYLICLSLLIPQLEDAIRNLVEKSGGTTLRRQKGGKGFQVRTFDDILRDPIVENCFNGDIAFYLRILYTDQRGWNMRNDICHGLAPASFFNEKTADRVLHSLLIIGLVIEKS